MRHLCDGSLHSPRRATIPPSAPSRLFLGFSRSRQSLPTIKRIDAMRSMGNIRILLLRVRTGVKAIAFTAVTRSCVAHAALQTSGPAVQATLLTRSSLQGAARQLRGCIDCPRISSVLARPKGRPCAPAKQKKHAHTRKKGFGKDTRQQPLDRQHVRSLLNVRAEDKQKTSIRKHPTKPSPNTLPGTSTTERFR